MKSKTVTADTEDREHKAANFEPDRGHRQPVRK